MLKDGITLMHEHTKINLSSLKNDDCNFNDYESIVSEYKKLYDYGVRNIVDVTNIGMGRDIDYVKSVARECNINIISCTGFYQQKFFPENMCDYSLNDLAKILIKEITEGIENSGVKARLIGEIGTSKNEMTTDEEKLFKAAVIAQKKTGVCITTHCTLGTYALEQVKFFEKEGADLNKIVIGHTDLTGDINYILEVLKKGVYIEFDTIGKNNYMSDEIRIECLKTIINKGYGDKIFLSMDITRKSNLESKGGIGFKYLFESFLPKCLNEGISQQDLDKMLITNPRNFLGVK